MLEYKELYCDATIIVIWFFIVYLPKKMETEKWPKAADSPLRYHDTRAFIKYLICYTYIYIFEK